MDKPLQNPVGGVASSNPSAAKELQNPTAGVAGRNPTATQRLDNPIAGIASFVPDAIAFVRRILETGEPRILENEEFRALE